jgi:hypothetical protein
VRRLFYLRMNGMKTTTLEDRIRWQLQASYPEWTPTPVLARTSLHHNPPILSLRKQGWQIANRAEHKDGAKHRSFQLAAPPSWPNPKQRISVADLKRTASLHDQEVIGSLFGDLAQEHRDDG